MIQVVSPGPLTLILDQGRYAGLSQGLSACGPMDPLSLHLALALTGAGEDAAALEFVLQGPVLRFSAPALVAVTGAPAPCALDGVPVPMYRTVQVQPGQTLHIGSMKEGLRGYVSIAGGLQVPPVLGSRATDLKSGLGGLSGRSLREGDILSFSDGPEVCLACPPLSLPPRDMPWTVRFLPGPQADCLRDGMEALTASVWTVGSDSDRMGLRLRGTPLQGENQGSMITEGVTMGSLQLPPGGCPLLMMADHQATGGYPKIATVISADLTLCAQIRPGQSLRFQPVTLSDARSARGLLLTRTRPAPVLACRDLCVRFHGSVFTVNVTERETGDELHASR